MRASSTEVRELESAASVRTSPRRLGRHQQNAAHRAVAGDSRAGKNLQFLARELERGHDADVRRARCQRVGALGRQAELQLEHPPLGPVQHAPDQRRSIQEADRANPRLTGIREAQSSSLP